MWGLSNIGNFIHSLFDKTVALFKKMFNLAKPFLQEVLSKTAQNVWVSSQSLFIEAIQYVAIQGLPNEADKQKAFKEYMTSKAKDQVEVLKTSELNLLREMALAIVNKAKEQS